MLRNHFTGVSKQSSLETLTKMSNKILPQHFTAIGNYTPNIKGQSVRVKGAKSNV